MTRKLASLTLAAVLGAGLVAVPALAQSTAPTMSGAMQNQMVQDRADDQAQMRTYDQKSLDIPKSSQFQAVSPDREVAEMGRGVDMLAMDDFLNTGDQDIYNEKTFRTLRDAGFSTVRVNMLIFGHMDDAGTIDPAWLKRLDWVVATATKSNLHVILDEHDFDACSAVPDSCTVLLRDVWGQLAPHYANEPNTVMFELLSEPHGGLTPKLWNDMLPQVLGSVRETNPERNVIVGPTSSNGIDDLANLAVPINDHNLIVSIRLPAGGDLTNVGAQFDTAQAWGKTHDLPIFLSGFSADDKATPDASAAYAATVARAAEAHGFAFAYWQYVGPTGVWDGGNHKWVEPVLHALVPDSKE